MSGSLPHAIANHSLMSTNSSGYSSFNQRTDNHTDSASLNARNASASSDFVVTISEQGQALSQKDQQSPKTEKSSSKNKLGNDLTDSEKQQVEDLRKRDQEVRQHEQAHASVGGAQTGSPHYTFTTGPDGKQYATDGEVPITINRTPRKPDQVIRDMNQVYRAALAPKNPSSVDRQAAAEAQGMILQAEQQKEQQTTDKTKKAASEASASSKQDAKLNAYKTQPQTGDFVSQMV